MVVGCVICILDDVQHPFLLPALGDTKHDLQGTRFVLKIDWKRGCYTGAYVLFKFLFHIESDTSFRCRIVHEVLE